MISNYLIYIYNILIGGTVVLKPYLVEKDVIKIIGKSIRFGGNIGRTEDIGHLFSHSDEILNIIPDRVNNYFLGVSIDFWQANRESGLKSYLLGAEVSTLKNLPSNLESRTIPASRWIYIPVRFDDEEVKSLAAAQYQDDMGYLTGCVFQWAKRWIKEKGYVRQDFSEELEIYNLSKGYNYPDGDGAELTLAIAIQ